MTSAASGSPVDSRLQVKGLGHRALTSGGVIEIVFDAAQRAGLPTMHAHRLRHTAATIA